MEIIERLENVRPIFVTMSPTFTHERLEPIRVWPSPKCGKVFHTERHELVGELMTQESQEGRRWLWWLVQRDAGSGRGRRRLAQIQQRQSEGDRVLEATYELALHFTRQQEPEARSPNIRCAYRALEEMLDRRDVPRKTTEGLAFLLPLDDETARKHADERPGSEQQVGVHEALDKWFRTEKPELARAWIATRLADESIRAQAKQLRMDESYLRRQLLALDDRLKVRARDWLGAPRLLVWLVACASAIGWWLMQRKWLLWAGGAGVAVVGVTWWMRPHATPGPGAAREVASPPPAEVSSPRGVEFRYPVASMLPPSPAMEPTPWLTVVAPVGPPGRAVSPALVTVDSGNERQPGESTPKEPEDIVDLCGSYSTAEPQDQDAPLSRGDIALMLLARDPATAEERALLSQLLQRPDGAFVYADVPPPAPGTLRKLDELLVHPGAEDCPTLNSAAMYVLSLRQVYRGHGEPCWGQSHGACLVGSTEPLQSDHLVTIVCRALLNNGLSADGAPEVESACHPPFREPHPMLRDGPWGSNDWYSPPASVLAELLEATATQPSVDTVALPLHRYLRWLQDYPPGAFVSVSQAEALLTLLPNRLPGEIR